MPVCGKIASISKNVSGNDIQIVYTYDASGNRITKKVIHTVDGTKTTFYVRDASGNVMSIYKRATATAAVEQTELHLYGSRRLGIKHKDSIPAQTGIGMTGGYTGMLTTFTRGKKLFELSNHLGNVLVTISDKKL